MSNKHTLSGNKDSLRRQSTNLKECFYKTARNMSKTECKTEIRYLAI